MTNFDGRKIKSFNRDNFDWFISQSIVAQIKYLRIKMILLTIHVF